MFTLDANGDQGAPLNDERANMTLTAYAAYMNGETYSIGTALLTVTGDPVDDEQNDV